MDFQSFADEFVLEMTSLLKADEKQKGRLNYTLAHELGHNVYHRRKFEEPDYSTQPLLFDEEPKESFVITCHRDNIENPDNTQGKDWVKWQADYFPSCFLMPKESVAEF